MKCGLLLTLSLVVFSFALGFLSAEWVLVGENLSLNPLPAKEFSASIDVVAVRQGLGVGVVNRAGVEVKPGKGRVLFALNPFVEPDTQQSAEIAASVAQRFTKKSLAGKDVIYSIEAGNVQLVGGPSAGAALAAATIAAIEERDLNVSVAITGTILPDGSIGRVGGIIEKAAAVAGAGKTLFLVPREQGTVTFYERQVVEERHGFVVIQRINYVPKRLDLNEFAKQQGWDLRIREVANIEEAVSFLLT